jgi:hypothetical protein
MVRVRFASVPRAFANAGLGNKMASVNEHGMRGVEFWTMAQTGDASGAYPLLEAVKP